MSKNINQIFIANPITSNASTDLMYFGQSPYGVGNDAAMTYANFSAQFGAPYTASALTAGNDTNVTLTLGGTPATALLHAASITAGWTGTLSGTRGGTGVNNGASTATYAGNLNFAAAFTTSGAFAVTQTYTGITSVTFPTSGTLATTSQLPTPAALTAGNDTNVTLTLGGTPATALLQAASVTAGWTGTLSGTRGGTGVNNGSNTATFAGNLNFANSFTTSGNFAVTQTYTNTTNVTFPTSGTLATTTQVITNVNQNSSSATLAANSRYATNNGASLVTYTIPAGAAVGDTYIIVGGSSGGWTVAQPASVQCHVGSSATTSGATGTISSSNQYDCCTITCVASNVFTVYGVQGNLTIV